MLCNRAYPRWRQDPAESVSGRANALDQCSLWHQLNVELARHHLALRFGIEADVADDDRAYELGADELANAGAGQRCVIGDHREIFFSLTHDFIDDAFGRSHSHEAANHQTGAVG